MHNINDFPYNYRGAIRATGQALRQAGSIKAPVISPLKNHLPISQTDLPHFPNQSELLELTRKRDSILFDYLDKIKEVQMSSLNALSLLQTLPQINANLERVALLLERGISSPTQASPHQSTVPSAPKVLNQAPVLLQPIQSQPKQSQKVIEAKTVQPTLEKAQIKQNLLVKSVAIQTQKEQKPVQQTQIKESINKQSEFPRFMSVVPFQQNNIIIDFEGFLNRTGKPDLGFDDFKVSMSRWLSSVYQQVTQKSFMGYFSRYLNHEQTKVFFTKNIVINFTRFAQYVEQSFKPLWKDKSIELIEHFEKQSSKILEYTAVKFPQQQKAYVSAEVKSAIEAFDHSSQPELDYLFNTGIVFPNRSGYETQTEEYICVVKTFLNKIMELTDANAKQWRSLMKDLFTVDGKELQNQVGTKFKENTPRFSKEEIEQNGIKIKAPEVLRIIVKWAEELEQKCYGIHNGTILGNRFFTQQGKTVLLTQKMKDAVPIRSWEDIQRIQGESADMLMELRQVASLFPQYLRKYEENFQYLDSDSVKSGLFSYVISQTASHLTINYLVFLIHRLKQKAQQIESQVDPKQLSEIDIFYQSKAQDEVFLVDFVSFKISDLLRSKCVGTLQQIKKVYEKLKNHPDLKVYRVKNRIDTSNRDFLVNVQLKGTPMLCEVQLKILQKAADEKQSHISHFNHLLYQLSRAKYGPIGEAVMINSYLTDFVPFFRDRIPKTDNNESNLVQFEVQQDWSQIIDGRLWVQGFDWEDNNTSFICANCLCFREAYCGYLRNYKRKKQQNSKASKIQIQIQEKVCGVCVYHRIPPQIGGVYLLRSYLVYFFNQKKEFPLEEIPDLICLIKKNAPSRSTQIVQNTHIYKNQTQTFVPAFWSVFNERNKIISQTTSGKLKLKYYMFSLREDVKLISVSRLALLEQYRESKKKEIGLEQNQYRQPERIDVPVNLNQPKLETFFYSHQNLFYFDKGPNEKYAFDVPILTLKFAEGIKENILEESESEKVLILYRPKVKFLLLVSDVTTREQIEKYVNKRAFTKELIQTLKRETKWDLHDRDLDNQSLEGFKGVSLPATKMNFKTNKLAEIPDLLANELRELNLQNNRIQQFKIDASTFPKLVALKLNNNRIRSVGQVQHPTLQQLDLSYNRIVSLNESEWAVSHLSNLDVSSNRIVNINLKYFANCHTLYFGQNAFEEIEFAPVFPNLKNLGLTALSKVKVDLSEISFPKLEGFYVYRCQLPELLLPNSLPSLQVMGFSNCTFEFIDFNKDFPCLWKLTMSQCHQVKQINAKWFPNKLEKINQFEINSMGTLQLFDLSDVCFPSLSQFKIVDCNVLQKVVLPMELPSLVFFEIDDTKITQINLPQNLPKLRNLQLKCNKLKKLDFSNLQCGSLSRINCENNELEQITFGPFMVSIDAIWVTHNKLKQLDCTVLPLSQLVQIRCGYNQIQRIKFAEDSAFPFFQILKIHNNPIRLPEGCNIAIDKIKMPRLDNFKSGLHGIWETTTWIVSLLSETEHSQLQLQAQKQADLTEFMKTYKTLSDSKRSLQHTQKKCLQLLKIVLQIERMKHLFGKDIEKMISEAEGIPKAEERKEEYSFDADQ